MGFKSNPTRLVFTLYVYLNAAPTVETRDNNIIVRCLRIRQRDVFYVNVIRSPHAS